MTPTKEEIETLRSKSITVTGGGKIIDLRFVRELSEEKGYDMQELVDILFDKKQKPVS